LRIKCNDGFGNPTDCRRWDSKPLLHLILKDHKSSLVKSSRCGNCLQRKRHYETTRHADSVLAALSRRAAIPTGALRSLEGRGGTALCRSLLRQGAGAVRQSSLHQTSA